jgi:hypothetical protein
MSDLENLIKMKIKDNSLIDKRSILLISTLPSFFYFSFFIISFIIFICFSLMQSVNYLSYSIECPKKISEKKIRFIEPSFTYAAYQNGSFYTFYDIYK